MADHAPLGLILPNGRELELRVARRSAPAPAVVYLHGGGFAVGSHRAEDNPMVGLLAETLLPRGLALASAAYRLSGEAIYPAPVQDAAAAVAWLRTHGSEHGIDGQRIGAWGDSAGGYLVAMLAVNAVVAAGVSWYGPTDLRCQPRLGPPQLGLTDPAQSPESRLLGAAVETVPQLAAQASPITRVTTGAAPMLCVHGTDDDGIPAAQSERLIEAYRRAGTHAELITMPGAGHGFRGTQLAQALTGSAEFLTRYLC